MHRLKPHCRRAYFSGARYLGEVPGRPRELLPLPSLAPERRQAPAATAPRASAPHDHTTTPSVTLGRHPRQSPPHLLALGLAGAAFCAAAGRAPRGLPLPFMPAAPPLPWNVRWRSEGVGRCPAQGGEAHAGGGRGPGLIASSLGT